MRDVAEGKVNRARINIPAWMEDDRAEGERSRRREKNGWTPRKKEIEHEEKVRIANVATNERMKEPPVGRNRATGRCSRVDFIRGRPS